MGIERDRNTIASLDDIGDAMARLFDALYDTDAAYSEEDWARCNYNPEKDSFHFYSSREGRESCFEFELDAQGKTPAECAELLFARIMAFKPRSIKDEAE